MASNKQKLIPSENAEFQLFQSHFLEFLARELNDLQNNLENSVALSNNPYNSNRTVPSFISTQSIDELFLQSPEIQRQFLNFLFEETRQLNMIPLPNLPSSETFNFEVQQIINSISDPVFCQMFRENEKFKQQFIDFLHNEIKALQEPEIGNPDTSNDEVEKAGLNTSVASDHAHKHDVIEVPNIANEVHQVSALKNVETPKIPVPSNPFLEFNANGAPIVANEINILVIGETGVGKSTWINGIANYMNFNTFEDALFAPNPICLIPMNFNLYSGANYEKVQIKMNPTVGEDDDENEAEASSGQS